MIRARKHKPLILLGVRVPQALKAKIKKMARRHKMVMSAYIRTIIDNALAKES